jgi:hypothetical protein
MRLPSWLRPFATHLNPVHKRRPRPRPAFRPLLEWLEDRLAPATLTVNSTGDAVSGTTSVRNGLRTRIAELAAHFGQTAQVRAARRRVTYVLVER